MNTAQNYWDILKRQPRPLTFFASRILWRTHACGLFTIHKEGYRLKFHPTALSATLWIDPQSRQEDEIFLKRYLRRGDTFVDVGANIGQLTLAAASLVGEKGKVYSVEPHPRPYGFLCANVALNKYSNIHLFNLALDNKESDIFFADLGRSDVQNRVSENAYGIAMKTAKLDGLPITEQDIRLLKIDVEGYEKFVLEGATETLNRISCVYFESCECHFERYNYTCRDVTGLLLQNHFKVVRFTGDHSLAPVNTDYSSKALENLVAVRDMDDFLNRTQLHLTV